MLPNNVPSNTPKDFHVLITRTHDCHCAQQRAFVDMTGVLTVRWGHSPIISVGSMSSRGLKQSEQMGRWKQSQTKTLHGWLYKWGAAGPGRRPPLEVAKGTGTELLEGNSPAGTWTSAVQDPFCILDF